MVGVRSSRDVLVVLPKVLSTKVYLCPTVTPYSATFKGSQSGASKMALNSFTGEKASSFTPPDIFMAYSIGSSGESVILVQDFPCLTAAFILTLFGPISSIVRSSTSVSMSSP